MSSYRVVSFVEVRAVIADRHRTNAQSLALTVGGQCDFIPSYTSSGFGHSLNFSFNLRGSFSTPSEFSSGHRAVGNDVEHYPNQSTPCGGCREIRQGASRFHSTTESQVDILLGGSSCSLSLSSTSPCDRLAAKTIVPVGIWSTAWRLELEGRTLDLLE